MVATFTTSMTPDRRIRTQENPIFEAQPNVQNLQNFDKTP
jgi:hypothetical protein